MFGLATQICRLACCCHGQGGPILAHRSTLDFVPSSELPRPALVGRAVDASTPQLRTVGRTRPSRGAPARGGAGCAEKAVARVFTRMAGAPPPKRLRMVARAPASVRSRRAATEARGAPPPPPASTRGVKNWSRSGAARATCRQMCVSATRAPAREANKVGAAARRGAAPLRAPSFRRACPQKNSVLYKSAPSRGLQAAAAATPGARPAMVPKSVPRFRGLTCLIESSARHGLARRYDTPLAS